jgi:hypothetical protein
MVNLERRIKRIEIALFLLVATLLAITWFGNLVRSIQEIPPKAQFDGDMVTIFLMDGYQRPFVVTHLVARLPGQRDPISVQVTHAPIRAESGRFSINARDLRWLSADGDTVKPPPPNTKLGVVYLIATSSPAMTP